MTPGYYSRLHIQSELTFYAILDDFLKQEVSLVRDGLEELNPNDPENSMTRVVFEGILAYLNARREAVDRGLWDTKKKQVL